MKVKRFNAIAVLFAMIILSPEITQAQVFGPGPSNSNLFDNVINLSDDSFSNPGQSIGGVNEQTTQLNLVAGPPGADPAAGILGNFFTVLAGAELNISAGTVGERLVASAGSEVNISGGEVGGGLFNSPSSLTANSGSVVNITGGAVGRLMIANGGSQVNISGGTVGNSLTLRPGSVVNITDGTVRSLLAESSELNFSGGSLGSNSEASSDSVVTFNGGTTSRFRVFDSEVNVSGSSVISDLDIFDDSLANISGGTIETVNIGPNVVARISGGSSRLAISPGSDVELIGGEFRLNGADFFGGTISLTEDDVFTGTLVDGSAFFVLEPDSDVLTDVTLTRENVPPLDLTPIVVNTPEGASLGLRPGQTLTLLTGGSLRDGFAVVEASLNIDDGTVGDNVIAYNSVVNMTGGTVGNRFHAISSTFNIDGGAILDLFDAEDSVVNVSDGSIRSSFMANEGSEVNITGGTLNNLDANEGATVSISGGRTSFLCTNTGSVVNVSEGSIGSFAANGEVNISGGTIGGGNSFAFSPGGFFQALPESVVQISGGTFSRFRNAVGSDVELIGGAFRVNGEDFSGETITLSPGDVFTGVLADGSTFQFIGRPLRTDGSGFAFGFFEPDVLIEVRLTRVLTPELDIAPVVVQTPIVSGPSGIRSGQNLTVQNGGSLRSNFTAIESTLTLNGGSVGDSANAYNSEININEGTLGNNFTAFFSEVNVTGGSLGAYFLAGEGSTVNISGGTHGMTDDFLPSSGTTGYLGAIVDGFSATRGSVVNIVGTEFFLNDVELDNLQPGEPFTITNRDAVLSGALADGEPFRFEFTSENLSFFDFALAPLSKSYYDPDATVTIRLPAIVLGDVSGDGLVNFLDISPFIAILATNGFQEEADIDRNGVVNFLDIAPFIEVLTRQ